MNTSVLIGIMIPFIGTTLGAACVFFMKQKMDNRVQKVLLGFASGVMIAASVWSLLIPALDMSASLGNYSTYAFGPSGRRKEIALATYNNVNFSSHNA